MSEFPIVHVRWIDSGGPEGYWAARDSDLPIMPIESVGYLVHDESQYITIAASVSKYQFGGAMSIPRVAIMEIRTIEATGA